MENNLWTVRIGNANKHFDEWESKFKCKKLEEYWEGFQWKNQSINYNPYTINLFYSTIKIKLASLLFQRPQFIVGPRPGNSNWNLEMAVQSATLKQDTLNTIVQNPNCHFVEQVKLSALDSFFRFSLIEVGYAADWRNPGKEPILLKSHLKEDVQEDQDRVIEDNEVPINERFYFKRINPRRFRVSVSDANELNDHEWVGYYDYYYTSELKHTKGIKWPKDEESYTYSADFATDSTISKDLKGLLDLGKVSKVWHIWDLVAKKRLLILDSSKSELWSDSFERLPIIDHRWDLRTEGWYPIPPAFQWLSSQDEINESREQTRSYRKRFTRKYQIQQGQISEEEKQKFASGTDGELIEVSQRDAISPISNPEIGHTSENALILAKDDFNIISGTSSEARGQADRETATAAKIKSVKSQIRESAEQLEFSNFLCRIGREMLAQASEKLANGLWIKYSADPGQSALSDMNVTGPAYKYVSGQDLSDGYDFDIEIDITNATPAAMQQAQQAFVQFLSLVTQFPMINMSPVLIREAAYRCGYRNEQVIQQMQQVALLSMAAKAAQAGGGAIAPGGGNANNVAATQTAQMNPGTEQEVQNQLDQQLMM